MKETTNNHCDILASCLTILRLIYAAAVEYSAVKMLLNCCCQGLPASRSLVLFIKTVCHRLLSSGMNLKNGWIARTIKILKNSGVNCRKTSFQIIPLSIKEHNMLIY